MRSQGTKVICTLLVLFLFRLSYFEFIDLSLVLALYFEIHKEMGHFYIEQLKIMLDLHL